MHIGRVFAAVAGGIGVGAVTYDASEDFATTKRLWNGSFGDEPNSEPHAPRPATSMEPSVSRGQDDDSPPPAPRPEPTRSPEPEPEPTPEPEPAKTAGSAPDKPGWSEPPDIEVPDPPGNTRFEPHVAQVVGAGKTVALTFDDGPGENTQAILDVLDKHDVPATFFAVGQMVERNPQIVRRMDREGHEVANHSWNHARLSDLGPEELAWQLRSTSDEIEAVTGERPTLFRAPYGARTEMVDRVGYAEGMRDVLWDVDTSDWERPGVDAIVNSAVHGARNGSIILMHDGPAGREQTAAAVEQIIVGLKQRGYDFATASDLIESGDRALTMEQAYDRRVDEP